MRVLKFGGTSVGSVESIKNVKKIAESSNEEVIVVVSALGGITDKLIETAHLATAGDTSYLTQLEGITKRHHHIITEVVAPEKQEALHALVEELLEELTNIYKGVYLIHDLSERTLNTIVSYGEWLSSHIVSQIIEGATHYDSRQFIQTENHFNKHVVNFAATNQRIGEVFATLPRVAVVPGFISSDHQTGEITNLGRGGSDYTAALLAAALNAKRLEIWTDVDGFMTADPRIIENVYVIDHLTFIEAMELCNFGAKVIYPPTIYPVYEKNIPILIKNTFNPAARGTLISQRPNSGGDGKAIKGVSAINDSCLITVTGLGMVGVIGVNYRIFRALAKNGISVFLVSQAASENNTSFGVKNTDADHAVAVLEEEFAKEIKLGDINQICAEKNLATVAIVGENMKHTPGIAGKLFNTLGRNGINVIACAQGASETNISFVIALTNLRKALNVIHDSFFLSSAQVINLFVAGIGLVGRNLLEQIGKQQNNLLVNNGLKLNIVGISNSRKCVFDRDHSISVEDYMERLEEAELEASPEVIRDEIIRMNIFNSVFVDCTASPQIAGIYKELLEHNVSVVTANKIAASGSYESYAELKDIARKRGVKFLFETNVGAGLPIINTINSLINSGDKILKIEAVVSGTLNYIFNVLSEDVPLSRAIKMAQEAGYSEPDPRLDLNGLDVVRKLVILAREAGYRVEQEEVVKKLFLPDSMFEGSMDDFWQKLPTIDAAFEEQRKAIAAEGKRSRFVAKLEEGRTEVSLQNVDSKHPFYHLEGSNNVVLVTTERYNEYPMVIKGYGAGAAVTAAGVFADVISIVNIR